MKQLNWLDSFKNWKRKLRWNRQYRKGKWNYLYENEEKPRYQKIYDTIASHSNHPSILDLGSGEGVLRYVLKQNLFEANYYCGVDYSSVSINKAKRHNFDNSKFIVADLHYYTPDLSYDVIVFNEAFYYINHKLKSIVLDRILYQLKSGGLLIVSIFKEGEGCWNYFKRNDLEEIEFSKIESSKADRYWKIGVYKKL